MKQTKSFPSVVVAVIALNPSLHLHKSILSVQSALHNTPRGHIYLYINATCKTLEEYIAVNKEFLASSNITIIEGQAKSEGAARNELLAATNASVYCFVKAGNLVSSNYFEPIKDTFFSRPAVAYGAASVYFFDKPFTDSIAEYSLDYTSFSKGALLMTEPRQTLTSIIFSREIIDNQTFPENSAYQDNLDWFVVSIALTKDAPVKRTPQGAVYIRHKNPHVMLSASTHTPRTSMLLPSVVISRQVDNCFTYTPKNASFSRRLKDSVKGALDAHPTIVKTAQISLLTYHETAGRLRRLVGQKTVVKTGLTAEWLIERTREVHLIEPKVYLHDNNSKHLNKQSAFSESNAVKSGMYYSECIKYLTHDTYDYILIVPWLIAGGADMFFMNYASTIQKLYTKKRVLVISTEPSQKSLPRDELTLLDRSVDFLPLAEIVDNNLDYHANCMNLLKIVIEQVSPRVIHVANSLIGYLYLIQSKQYLADKLVRQVATGYNEVVHKDGHRRGYVHEFIPDLYSQLSLITTDNVRIVEMWEKEYGIDTKRVLVHHQPFLLPTYPKQEESYSQSGKVRLVWASHIRKEKGPEMAVDIARHFANNPDVSIDCYGSVDTSHYPSNPFTSYRGRNLHYRGAFKNLYKDIDISQYDAFLYTSLYDGTPNILIEMGLSKIPIISSAIGGIPALLGSDGTLIENPHDPAEFIDAIQKLSYNKSPFIKRAHKLSDKLTKTHTYAAFNDEIIEMLDRLDYR